MKILIADDQPVVRLTLRRLLESQRHEVVDCADGDAAWAALQAERFDVAILDWMMPGRDGPALCMAIRQDDKHKGVYLILLTALEGTRHHVDGLDAGADDFLTKPVDPEILTSHLRVAARRLGQATEQRNVFRFVDFELDGNVFELRKDGKAVPVEPKALDLLFYLVRNRNRMVSKEELLDKVWPGVRVTEWALSQAVMLARRAFGDDGESQSFIKTVRGRGYRFVAEEKE